MSSRVMRLIAVLGAVVIVAGAISLLVSKFTRSPTPVAAIRTGPGQAQLTLATTPAVGELRPLR